MVFITTNVKSCTRVTVGIFCCLKLPLSSSSHSDSDNKFTFYAIFSSNSLGLGHFFEAINKAHLMWGRECFNLFRVEYIEIVYLGYSY